MRQMIIPKITYCFSYLISDLRLLQSIMIMYKSQSNIYKLKDNKSGRRSASSVIFNIDLIKMISSKRLLMFDQSQQK